MRVTSADSATGSTQRNVPAAPKWPKVAGEQRVPVQCGTLWSRHSNPRPQSFGSSRPNPGRMPARPGNWTVVASASVERAIYSMREAFLAYAGGQAAANGAAAAVINNYYSISTINIYSSGEQDFDQLMESLGRRADLALQGSGA